MFVCDVFANSRPSPLPPVSRDHRPSWAPEVRSETLRTSKNCVLSRRSSLGRLWPSFCKILHCWQKRYTTASATGDAKFQPCFFVLFFNGAPLNKVSCQVNRENLTLDNPLWRWDCCVTTNREIFLYLIIITIVIVIVVVIIIFTRPFATFWAVSFRLRRSARIGYCCSNVGKLLDRGYI